MLNNPYEKTKISETLRTAITKTAIYASHNGYFPDENGAEKKFELEDLLSHDELREVRPYVDTINEVVNGFPNFNEIPKRK